MTAKALKGSGIIWRTINGSRIPLVIRDGKAVPKGGPRGLVAWWQARGDTDKLRLGKNSKVDEVGDLIKQRQAGKLDRDEFERRLDQRAKSKARIAERDAQRWADEHGLYETPFDMGRVTAKRYEREMQRTREWFEKHVGSPDDPRFDEMYNALHNVTDAERDAAARRYIGGLAHPALHPNATGAMLAAVTRSLRGAPESSDVPIRLGDRPTGGTTGSYSRRVGDSMGTLNILSSDRRSHETMMHELGHHLEASNGRVHDAAWQFLLKRMGSDGGWNQVRGDNAAHPVPSALERFPNPYTAKVYKWGDTEVTSTGIEAFTYPEQFRRLAKNDPEHFFFTLAALRGSFGVGYENNYVPPEVADMITMRAL